MLFSDSKYIDKFSKIIKLKKEKRRYQLYKTHQICKLKIKFCQKKLLINYFDINSNFVVQTWTEFRMFGNDSDYLQLIW